jgi:hypothetical protein
MTKNRKSMTGRELVTELNKKLWGLVERESMVCVKDIYTGLVTPTRNRLDIFGDDISTPANIAKEMYVQKVTFGSNCVDTNIYHIVPLSKYWRSTTGFAMYSIVGVEILERDSVILHYDSRNSID